MDLNIHWIHLLGDLHTTSFVRVCCVNTSIVDHPLILSILEGKMNVQLMTCSYYILLTTKLQDLHFLLSKKLYITIHEVSLDLF